MSWKASIAAIQEESRQEGAKGSASTRSTGDTIKKTLSQRTRPSVIEERVSFDHEEQDQRRQPPSRRKANAPPAYESNEDDDNGEVEQSGRGIAILQDKANAIYSTFQKATFNGDTFINSHFTSLDEKGIEQASQSLEQLNEYCSQELQNLVFEQNLAFLQATREIALLDQAVSEIRVVVNSSEELKEVLTRKISSEADALAGSSNSINEAENLATLPQGQSDEEVIVEELIADLEVASSARDLAAATTILKAGATMLQVIDRDKTMLRQSGLNVVTLRNRLESALEESRLILVEKLEADLNDIAVSTAEIRFSSSYLAYLSGDCRAAGSLLACYSMKLSGRRMLQRKATDAEDSLRLAGSLAQDSFLLISSVFYDISAVFGQAMQEVYALATQWAMHEVRLVSRHVRQQILGRLNSAQDMADVARIVSLLLVACLTIEQEHGVCLDSKVIPEVWGALENVTLKQMARIAVERKIQAQEDCYRLLDNPATSSRVNGLSHEIWPSASQLLDDISVMVECLQPLSALAPSDTWSRLLGPGIFAGLSALARGCKSGLQKAIASRDLRIRPTKATVKIVSDLVSQTASQIKHLVHPLELSCGCGLLSLGDVQDMISRLELTLLVSEQLSDAITGPAMKPCKPESQRPSGEPQLTEKPKMQEPSPEPFLAPSAFSAGTRSPPVPQSNPEGSPRKGEDKPKELEPKVALGQAPQSRAQAALARAMAARAAKKGESSTARIAPSPPLPPPPPPPPLPLQQPSPPPYIIPTRNEPIPGQADHDSPSAGMESEEDPPRANVEGPSKLASSSKPQPQESRAKAALERAMAARKKSQQPQERPAPPPPPPPAYLLPHSPSSRHEERETLKVPQSRAQAALARAAEMKLARGKALIPQPNATRATLVEEDDEDLL